VAAPSQGGDREGLHTLLYMGRDRPRRGARGRDAFGKPQFRIDLVNRRNDDGVFSRQLDRGIQEMSGFLRARRPPEGLQLKPPVPRTVPGCAGSSQ